MRLIKACLIASLALAVAPQARAGDDRRLALVEYGRFALFADLDSIARDGATARMRVFQVAEDGFAVGDVGYWGGWSWWAFDCGAETADRIDFASVREDGIEGPATADAAPPDRAWPGGDAALLLATACAPSHPAPDAASLPAAVALGRRLLAD